MKGVGDEIKKMLARPAETIRVAYIITASKTERDTSYVDEGRELLKEAGFNVEDIDIESKNQDELMKLLSSRNIIYVQGGNTFYLLKHMRLSGFDKIIRKLLKMGIIYVGVSAGSMVAGKNIEAAGWKDADRNEIKLKDLRGLSLVPFNIFVHYNPEEHKEMITQKPPRVKRRLRVLTDEQAFLVQNKTVILIGEGEENVFKEIKKKK